MYTLASLRTTLQIQKLRLSADATLAPSHLIEKPGSSIRHLAPVHWGELTCFSLGGPS